MTTSTGEVIVRRADDADRPAILRLAVEALGWEPTRPNAEFFSWKHAHNPFGPSPMWLAEIDGEVVGFRTFLRWEFARPDGSVARAVRAVDTATSPAHQGKGIFTRLTTGALDELSDDGVDFVFNTPNDQSRPGYLKMGWQVVGRVPVRIRARGLGGLLRVSRARGTAEKWSECVTAGEDATEALADGSVVSAALTAAEPSGALATRRSPSYLQWRYGFGPLRYRVARLSRDLTDGFAVFRVHRRGAAMETVLCELLAPDRGAARALVRKVTTRSGGDYVLGADRAPGLVPVPRQGPILTWRDVTDDHRPALRDWALSLGDVELF